MEAAKAAKAAKRPLDESDLTEDSEDSDDCANSALDALDGADSDGSDDSETRSLKLLESIIFGVPVNKDPYYDYILVIDFESTCWDHKDATKKPEIIEFPVLLYDLKAGSIASSFHQYLTPTENPKLSEFCTKFTGITQFQVDSGMSLDNCLRLFNKWLRGVSEAHKLNFTKQCPGYKMCTFVTWSDWDLGVCLADECSRKKIYKPNILNSWIDLKAIYCEFYKRRPQNLKGAIEDAGLKFEGREHCGLHDAINTAHLARQMIYDGAKLYVTRTNHATAE